MTINSFEQIQKIPTIESDLSTHTGTANIHFTEGSIVHQNISGAGTNTHDQIDTHVGSAAVHLPAVLGALGTLLRSNGTSAAWDASISVAADGKVRIGGSAAYNGTLDVRGNNTDTALYVTNGSNSNFTVNFDSGVTTIGNDFLGTLVFQTSSSPAMSIDSSGKVGIGTATAGALLTVESGAAGNGSAATYPGQVQLNQISISTLAQIGGLEFKASQFGSGYGNKITSFDGGDLVFGQRVNNAAWTERMRIASDGTTKFTGSLGVMNLGAGATFLSFSYGGANYIRASSASGILNLGGYSGLTLQTGSGFTTRLSIDSTGLVNIPNLAGSGSRTVTADAAGTLSAASDSRLKQEVVGEKLPGLDEILQVKPRAYKWLADIQNRGEQAATEIGFFANEVAEIIPSAAPMGNDGYYGLYDRSITAALVKAVQELSAKNSALEARILTLENKGGVP